MNTRQIVVAGAMMATAVALLLGALPNATDAAPPDNCGLGETTITASWGTGPPVEVGSEWAYTTPNKIDGIALAGQADSRRTDLDFGMWYRLR